jgi:hypothetical protein
LVAMSLTPLGCVSYKIRPYKQGPSPALEYVNVRVLPG